MADTISIDGTSYPLAHAFSPVRVIYELAPKVYVLADRVSGVWTDSGDPASPDEMVVLKALVDAAPDELTVTRDG